MSAEKIDAAAILGGVGKKLEVLISKEVLKSIQSNQSLDEAKIELMQNIIDRPCKCMPTKASP